MNLTIVGGGRAAWAIGSAWVKAGWKIDRVILRPGSTRRLPDLLSVPRGTPEEDIKSEIVLVAVTDDSMPSVCAAMTKLCRRDTWLFHPSGSHDSSVFGDRSNTFSLHPLRALPAVGEDVDLSGTLLVFEGADEARPIAANMAIRFGARFATVSRDEKPIYHAAAVIAANLVAAQLDIASELMHAAGLDVPDVRDEIAALSLSAIRNWKEREGPARFTGPIARGDVALVRRHLEHLSDHEEASRIYRSAGLALCRALLQSDPDNPRLLEIESLLDAVALP